MQEIVTTSKVKKMVGKFTHRVEGWSALSKAVGDHVESPQVELCGHQWRIRIFPGGSSHKHNSYISMYLANRSNSSVSASYKLYIHNQEISQDELIFQSNGVKIFDIQGQGKIDGWGRDRFLPYRKCQENGICQQDTIIFSVEISVYGEIEAYCQSEGIGSTLDQDMNKLFDCKDFSDIQVLVNGSSQEFSLHRSILSARSPVFRAMFNHPTRESTSGVILLHDDDVEVVALFFKFLYTDYLSESALRQHAPSLLVMASKYQVSLLVPLCEHAIVSSHLCTENAISLLEFSDYHGSCTMQKRILRFIGCNIENISNQNEYKELPADDRNCLRERVSTENGTNISSLRNLGSSTNGRSSHGRGKFSSFSCIMM